MGNREGEGRREDDRDRELVEGRGREDMEGREN